MSAARCARGGLLEEEVGIVSRLDCARAAGAGDTPHAPQAYRTGRFVVNVEHGPNRQPHRLQWGAGHGGLHTGLGHKN